MTHIDFVILNSHVTVIYLRFIKNTIFFFFSFFYFFCGKTEKIIISVFLPAVYPCI